MSYEISLSKYPFSADNQAWSFYTRESLLIMNQYSIKKSLLVLTLISAMVWICGGAMASPRIMTIDSIDFGNEAIRTLRDEIRQSIYIVKSGRDPESLPNLNFYRYRVKKGDTFWTILARTSQNIDTLMTVNSFSSPDRLRPAKRFTFPICGA